MLRRSIMAAAARKKGSMKGAESPGPGSVRKNASAVPAKTQLRLLNSQSSPVYKTQAAPSLTDGFRNLSIRDRGRTSNNTVKRNYFVGSSNATVKSLEDVAKLMKQDVFRKVVILAGAGISTPSGIPDFRTPGTGLYDNLQRYNIPYPEAIFDIDYFHHNPKPFFMIAKELYPSGKYRPNYTHYFARMLHEKGILLRMYTQNIDGLERLAGIPPEKLVEAHGTFATATCTMCDRKYNGEEIKSKIFEDKLPKCRQRGCPGLVKPDIVFFGEDLPAKFYNYLKDMLQTDLAIVMGTSLEVQPFAGIIENVRWGVPRVLFNKKAVGPFRHRRRTKDVVAEGDLLETTQKFVGMVGWKEEMAGLITKHEKEFKFEEALCAPTVPTRDGEKEDVIPYNFLSRQNACLNLLPDSESDSSETLSSSSVSSDSSEDLSSEEEARHKKLHASKAGARLNNHRNSKPTIRNGHSTQNGVVTNGHQPRNSKASQASTGKAPTPSDDASSVSDVASVSGRSVGKSSLRSLGNGSTDSKGATKGPGPGPNKDASRKFSTSVLSDVGPKAFRNSRVPGRKPGPVIVERKAPNLHNLERRLGRPPVSDRRPGPNSKTNAGNPSAIQIYRQIRRVGSADLPKLNYRHKLQRPYEERVLNVGPPPMYGTCSTSSSDSDSDSR